MKPDQIEVLAIGSAIVIGDDIPARITAITISGEGSKVAYDVVWWDGRDRRGAWLDASEVRSSSLTNQPLKIGFRSQ